MTLIGWLLVEVIYRRGEVLEKVAVGFLLGFGVITLSLFGITIFDIRLNQLIVYMVFTTAILVSLSLFLTVRRPPSSVILNYKNTQKFFRQQDILTTLLIMVISWFILFSLFSNLYWPVTAWDSLAVYDARALIYAKGGLLKDLWEQTGRDPYYFGYYLNSYPPSTSLAHAAVYILNDRGVQVLYTAFYASLIILFFANLSKLTGSKGALFFTAILASVPVIQSHSMMAYTNLPYTVYFFTSLLYLRRWNDEKSFPLFIISILSLALSVWIRTLEPFYLINLLVVAIAVLFARRKRFIAYFMIMLLVTMGMKLGWQFYFNQQLLTVAGIGGDLSPTKNFVQTLTSFNYSRLFEILIFLIKALEPYYYLLLIFAISIVVNPNHFRKNFILVLSVFISLVFLIPGTIVLSAADKNWYTYGGSVTRTMMFLIPVILFYVGSLNLMKVLEDPSKNTGKIP